MKRTRDALALYRGEIDRNPNDPGLYERLAVFLNQNKLAADLEQTYIRATQQFQDRTWHHKLARWYLRQKQSAQFDKLTKDIATAFSGTDLETYFREVIGQSTIDPVLYRQVNLYAYQRFPHDIVFVKNLLRAYTTKGTVDNAAWERLLPRRPRSTGHTHPKTRVKSKNFGKSNGTPQTEVCATKSAKFR